MYIYKNKVLNGLNGKILIPVRVRIIVVDALK